MDARANGEEPQGSELFADAGLYVRGELGTGLVAERIVTCVQGGGGSSPHPFGRAMSLTITREAVYSGTGEAFEIRRYSLDGELERIMRWPSHDLTIRQGHVDAYQDSNPDGESDRIWEARRRDFLESALPSAFPAFVRLETDPHGNVWAEWFRPPGEPHHAWSVFDTDGVFLGTVRLPSDLTVTDITDDLILGVTRDELGVERVGVYTLLKPGLD
jgi:hypothetical protein